MFVILDHRPEVLVAVDGSRGIFGITVDENRCACGGEDRESWRILRAEWAGLMAMSRDAVDVSFLGPFGTCRVLAQTDEREATTVRVTVEKPWEWTTACDVAYKFDRADMLRMGTMLRSDWDGTVRGTL